MKSLSGFAASIRKERCLSIRSFFRAARTDQRGFVLISVLVIALLYFAMLELMLMESGEALRNAQRFRARIAAQILAENAAELSAHNFALSSGKSVSFTDDTGEMHGKSQRLPGELFKIEGRGTVAGVHPHSATVEIHGHFEGLSLYIDRTVHSQ
jgi:Tfp pilus assembly protein PilV